MAYTINTLDIIPNGTTKFRCIHILDAGHSEIGQIVGTPEFLIQQSANIFIESAIESMQTNIIAASMQATPNLPIDQGITMIVPGIVLNAKCIGNIFSAATCKILICKIGILDVM